ncbi:hypothetical protein [Planktothrix agardhii]|uniref:Transposase n=1 Tax=Planktothrix agardhii TaxID=1160 RepID=A0A1J1JLL2_PLAAG|nr:hypothetical protein [Planktothrix agardhii]MCB8781778.1 hypothetical protein [Planktothrix agardhii 1808]MCB8786070.1 hypothetical protein [Planktothrix agardhii 1025]MCF3603405.1 hypothetical protein [Planktothrix agardhii 1804]MCF3613994.1 hypothetical protein [Planktothrix agardhii 1027]MCF3615688.1 hypothetical protein [Planktothrix agardhii 1806]BBD53323.1 transposase, IS605 OrfB family [Planktothrix agardhii NIES-204]
MLKQSILQKEGNVFSNIEGGYVQWQTLQLADLKNTKKLFPEYKNLDSQVLQDVVNRVETSFSNFTTPRWHSCECGESLDRDYNSANLIKKIGLNYKSGGGTPSLKKALAKREKEACGLTVRPWLSGSFTDI